MQTFRERGEIEARRAEDARLRLCFHNQELKKVPECFDLLSILEPYHTHFLADEKAFKPKTKSNSEEKRLLELVRYLFCKYRVGPQLTNVWLRAIPTPQRRRDNQGWGLQNRNQYKVATTIPDDPILWYLCVAQGGSLYKAHSKKYLTKMETHAPLNCSHELTFEQTLVYATAKTFAQSEGLALRLAHSKLHGLQFNDFLKTVIYFFAKNPPDSRDEVDDLVDYIIAKHRESEAWTLAGRTLESLRQKCKDWHFELRRIKVMGNFTWEGAPILDSTIQTGSSQQPMRWQFSQIRSSKLLAEEGNQMRHCVYGYKSQCINGHTSIWSLSRVEHGIPTRKVTIELSNSGDIVQARGLSNRTIRPEERHATQLWATDNGLRVMCR